MVITTIITGILYNNSGKIFIFGIFSAFIGVELWVFSKPKIAFIVSLFIFCSSPFLIMVKPNEFAIYYRDGQMPVVLENNIKLAIPYIYDLVTFDRLQTLIIVDDNNQKAIVDFELPRENVFMVQHGFADQKDFAGKIQAQAYSKFFTMNGVERKAYLDSFYNSHGLRVVPKW